MFDEFFSTASNLTQKGYPFATAIVVRAEKPTSGKPGDKAIVTADGVLHGWIGGSCAQPTVVKVALQALADGEPRLIRLSTDPAAMTPRDGLIDLPMTCYSGGTLEIYVEPQLPQPRLLIVGNLPVAHALAQLGRAMNYHVVVVDPEMGGAGMPEGVEVISGSVTSGAVGQWDSSLWAAIRARINSLTYVVVASHGNVDEVALEHALNSNAAYVGLVASQRRATSVKEYLAAQGISPQRIALLHCPAGLNIGARRGDEIALSIMAEIVQMRRSAEGIDFAGLLMDDGRLTMNDGRETGEERPKTEDRRVESRDWRLGDSANNPQSAIHNPQLATDPVCKMEVKIASAIYQSEYAGKRYYFCCAGCKLSFDRTPEQFITVIDLESMLSS